MGGTPSALIDPTVAGGSGIVGMSHYYSPEPQPPLHIFHIHILGQPVMPYWLMIGRSGVRGEMCGIDRALVGFRLQKTVAR